MPTAREALLNAAMTALGGLPWSAVRMVDVASAAGVSRQTLYNEFGSKEGLARALVRREADAYLYGVERALQDRSEGRSEDRLDDRPQDRSDDGSDAIDRLVSVAEWTVGEAAERPLLRALLTGCWGDRLPAPRPAPARSRAPAGTSAQRRADAGAPAPGELVAAVGERSRAALGHDEAEGACELAVRLALSYVIAPGTQDLGALLRHALGVSATSPTAEGR
ncbi:TetR/AcrR family transcriptional regulator [Streptomyces sp. CB03238]|uniref:TetR/AcrR family transcriptional regulator n=1 Tax=Streptomyces sp. CB03238 TaxID=1907777 RepID=UPI000A121608|nr:TetR/AcrR family transcriptional regulator [Streptomyces sp. CB03238]ORT61280.1 TetR family transcriptional regulator [Streptomyces sp. CB03238]